MDELALLRSARDFPAVPLDDLAKNRVALDKAIGGAASRKSAKRRMQRRAGWTFASVGVAAAIAIALVATDTIGFGGSPVGASAEAAEVLNGCADNSSYRGSDCRRRPVSARRHEGCQRGGDHDFRP